MVFVAIIAFVMGNDDNDLLKKARIILGKIGEGRIEGRDVDTGTPMDIEDPVEGMDRNLQEARALLVPLEAMAKDMSGQNSKEAKYLLRALDYRIRMRSRWEEAFRRMHPDPTPWIVAHIASIFGILAGASVWLWIRRYRKQSIRMRYCAVAVFWGSIVILPLSMAMIGQSMSGRLPLITPTSEDDLRKIGVAEEAYRAFDLDGNGVQDYWVGDVAGLNRIISKQGKPLKLISDYLAGADSEPLDEERGRIKYASSPPWKPISVFPGGVNIYYKMLRYDSYGKPYGCDIDNDGEIYENTERYGVCAYTGEESSRYAYALIINQEGIVWRKDIFGGKLNTWPADPVKDGWKRCD